MSLTMRPILSSRTGVVMVTGMPDQYKVVGLPAGQKAWIKKDGDHWNILRVSDGMQAKWGGNYDTAEDALRSLEKGDQPEGRSLKSEV